MFGKSRREREPAMREACPCFSLFVGLLLWGTRNSDSKPAPAKPR